MTATIIFVEAETVGDVWHNEPNCFDCRCVRIPIEGFIISLEIAGSHAWLFSLDHKSKANSNFLLLCLSLGGGYHLDQICFAGDNLSFKRGKSCFVGCS
jgi:hypothetical protein